MSWENNQGPWGQNNSTPPKGTGDGKEPDLEKLLQKGREIFDGGKGNGKFLILAIVLAGLGWLATGFYMVDEKEEAVVLRFGEYHRKASPGLHYRIPAPFESLIKVQTTVINRVEIGFRSRGRGDVSGQIREVPEESSMLTVEANIVDVPFEVQWVISDAEKFLFNLRDPSSTVKSAAESAMREVIGRTPISSAIAEGKQLVQAEARDLLQKILDDYDTGITIAALKLTQVKYPGPVRPAFTDVQNATTEADTAVKKAEAYRNDILPRARGQAVQVVEESKAYRGKIVAEAQGQAERFNVVYDKYSEAKEVTKKRIYLETMEKVLYGTNKIILDQDAGKQMVPFLPLNEINRKK